MPPTPRAAGRTLPVVLAALALSAPARANGRFPTAQMVQVSDGAHPARMVLRTTFGLLVGSDDGARWGWMCEAALGYGSQIWDPPVALGSAGADGIPLLVGVPTGLQRATDACGTRAVADVGSDYTADISATPDGATVHWVGSFRDAARNALVNRLRVSSDGGRSFRTVFEGLADVLVLTLEAAPSHPDRVYLSAHGDNPTRDAVYRSDDGGRTFTAFPMDLGGASQAWISGVDPLHPDTLYVRAFGGDPTLQQEPSATRLLRSTDGGATFTEIARTAGVMRGFAVSDDGRTLWIGGPDDGLLRSVDGGAFLPVRRSSVQCLRAHAGWLYVCGDHAVDGFDLARSSDGGDTLVPLVDFPRLAAPSGCAAGTVVHDQCAPTWPTVLATFGSDADAGPLPDAGTRTDAGLDAGMPSTPGGGGGGCNTGRSHGGAGASVLAAMLLAMSRRRRR